MLELFFSWVNRRVCCLTLLCEYSICHPRTDFLKFSDQSQCHVAQLSVVQICGNFVNRVSECSGHWGGHFRCGQWEAPSGGHTQWRRLPSRRQFLSPDELVRGEIIPSLWRLCAKPDGFSRLGTSLLSYLWLICRMGDENHWPFKHTGVINADPVPPFFTTFHCLVSCVCLDMCLIWLLIVDIHAGAWFSGGLVC